jgi:hypothetical protein
MKVVVVVVVSVVGQIQLTKLGDTAPWSCIGGRTVLGARRCVVQASGRTQHLQRQRREREREREQPAGASTGNGRPAKVPRPRASPSTGDRPASADVADTGRRDDAE